MAVKRTPRIRIPKTAKAGEVIEVKTLISHEMESGQRKDASGKPVPRNIIKLFTLKFNGKEIMRVDMHPAISANPYQAFYVKVPESGTFTFEWTEDDGTVHSADREVKVS